MTLFSSDAVVAASAVRFFWLFRHQSVFHPPFPSRFCFFVCAFLAQHTHTFPFFESNFCFEAASARRPVDPNVITRGKLMELFCSDFHNIAICVLLWRALELSQHPRWLLDGSCSWENHEIPVFTIHKSELFLHGRFGYDGALGIRRGANAIREISVSN